MQIGDNPKVFTEFYQPISLFSRYFVAPRFEFQERSVNLLDGEDRIAEYRVRTLDGGLDVGREFSNWGELRFGLRRGSARSRVLVGDPELPSEQANRGGMFARFTYDKLDSIFFPRRGQQLELEWRGERDASGRRSELRCLFGELADRAFAGTPHADFLDRYGHDGRQPGHAGELLHAGRLFQSVGTAARLSGGAALTASPASSTTERSVAAVRACWTCRPMPVCRSKPAIPGSIAAT